MANKGASKCHLCKLGSYQADAGKLVVPCALPEDISPTKAQQTVYRAQLAHQARKVARRV